MRVGVATSLLLLGLGATGCGSVIYTVSRDPGGGGVPFLPVESVDARTTRYGQSWVEVELSAEVVPPGTAPGDVARLKVVRSLLAYTENELAAATLVGDFNAAEGPEQAYRAAEATIARGGSWTRVPPAPRDLSQATWTAGLPVLSVSRTRTQQPAGRPLYLNVHVPAGGSGSGALQLAPNGTLTQASGELKDELPAAVVAGLGSVVTSAVPGVLSAVLPTVLPTRPGPPLAVVGARIRSTPWRRTYAVTTEWSASLGEAGCQAPALQPATAVPDGQVCRTSVAVELVRGGAPAPPPEPAPAPAVAPAR